MNSNSISVRLVLNSPQQPQIIVTGGSSNYCWAVWGNDPNAPALQSGRLSDDTKSETVGFSDLAPLQKGYTVEVWYQPVGHYDGGETVFKETIP